MNDFSEYFDDWKYEEPSRTVLAEEPIKKLNIFSSENMLYTDDDPIIHPLLT